jgi:flavin-dependent dehydrogenase
LLETDVFILGAGPAGACAALNLAPFYRVTIIDRENSPKPRAGESLPPAANKLLSDMGLLTEFQQQGHLAYFGNQSRWGSDHLSQTDFLRDPAGHGWHLNRQAFDHWLRQKALERGARILAPARIERLQSCEQHTRAHWRVTITHNHDVKNMRARVLIDAGGRTPGIAKRLGANRMHRDKLCCGWVIGANTAGAAGNGLSYIEATEHGWWYTAPTPGRHRILAFHSDADNPATKWMRSVELLLQQARATPYLAQRIDFGSFTRNPSSAASGYTSANSATTQPLVGKGWLSAGDAAISFDPLSSQGIFNALYTGLAAAESVDRYLRSEILDFQEYASHIQTIRHAYQIHLRQWYAIESRWHTSLFWKRRQGRTTGKLRVKSLPVVCPDEMLSSSLG